MHRLFHRYPRTQVAAGSGAANPALADSLIYYLSDFIPIAVEGTNFARADETYWLERSVSVYRYTHAGAEIAPIKFWALCNGICLHGDIPLLMIDPHADESQYLDTKAEADVYVEVTEGASTGNWYLVLDELQKTYPT